MKSKLQGLLIYSYTSYILVGLCIVGMPSAQTRCGITVIATITNY